MASMQHVCQRKRSRSMQVGVMRFALNPTIFPLQTCTFPSEVHRGGESSSAGKVCHKVIDSTTSFFSGTPPISQSLVLMCEPELWL